MKYSGIDRALINLGRVHAYASFLASMRLIPDQEARGMALRYYGNTREFGDQRMTFDQALAEAVRRRDEAFRSARARLKRE